VIQTEELDELTEMASTKRQAIIAFALGVPLTIGACALWLAGTITPATFGGLFFGAIFFAAFVGSVVKTPSSRLPAVAVLRERPAAVAYVVAMNRGGTRSIAIADQSGALLAPPLVLKGNIAGPKQAQRAFRADRDDLARAVEIVVSRNPAVQATAVSDHVGLASPAKLARTAIAKLTASV
jgi:hypothetical protein